MFIIRIWKVTYYVPRAYIKPLWSRVHVGRCWCVQPAQSRPHYHTYWSILENALIEIASPPDVGPGTFWQCSSPVTLLDFFPRSMSRFTLSCVTFLNKIIFLTPEFPHPICHCVFAIRVCVFKNFEYPNRYKTSILIAKQLKILMAIHVRPKFTLRSSAIHATRRGATLSFTVSGARSCKMSIIFYTRRNVRLEYKRRHRCNERKTYLLV